MAQIQVERVFVRFSKEHGFKPIILREIVILRNRGFNNLEIADETGVSRNTISTYIEKMREMNEDESAQLMQLSAMMMARHRRIQKEMLKAFLGE